LVRNRCKCQSQGLSGSLEVDGLVTPCPAAYAARSAPLIFGLTGPLSFAIQYQEHPMKASNDSNSFAVLNGINVNDHVEKKGPYSYLSWPYAVAQLRLTDPTASWEIKRFDGLPYLATETGVYVEVAVTVQGVTLSQLHPVLDGKNRPLLAPS